MSDRKREVEEIRSALEQAENARPWLPTGALQAMVDHETEFSPRMVEGKRRGVMLVPDDYLKKVGLSETDALDWKQNIRAGLTLLDELQSKFDSPMLAMTAYKAGEGKVADWQMGRQRLKRGEAEFAPAIMARSSRYGGVANHLELHDVAKAMGVEDLTRVYKRAGVAPPELPQGAQIETDDDLLANPHVARAMEAPIGRMVTTEPDGKKTMGIDPTARLAFENAPGAPSMLRDDLYPEDAGEPVPEPVQTGVPPQLAQALGLPDMSATLGPRVDSLIDKFWSEV